jgi:long-chain acyl-CoA synthetase
MDESRMPALVEIGPDESIPTLLTERLAAAPKSVAFERKNTVGAWTPVTVRDFATQVSLVARGLIDRGIRPGDRVALMSRTRYEWAVLDFAIWHAGAVTVPVYETSSAEQVAWMLSDSQATMIIVEDNTHAAVVASVRDELEDLTQVMVIDHGAVVDLATAGAAVAESEVKARVAALHIDTLATIIYTSGTTGLPKGVELTHGSFLAVSRNVKISMHEVCGVPGARLLLFLPLAHVYARFLEVLCLHSGAVIGFAPDTKNLLNDLASFKPTFLLAVPRVFEKVYNSAEQNAGASGKLKIFRWAAKVAITHSRAQDTVTGPRFALKIAHRIADLLVYRKLRAVLGGRTKWAVSGGAPLGERLGHFYRGIGLHVLEGYGLTETTAPTTVNTPTSTRIGTVGLPLPGTALRVAGDGELLIQGPHVFRGYHHNADATKAALVDGWFRTGDIGSIDDAGMVRITGRKKEIIVTAAGKNVAPALLEDRLRGHPLVSQCVVVGDARPFIGALVTLDAESLPGWLRAHGRPLIDVVAASTDPFVLTSLDRAVERTNRAVSHAEAIKKYTVLTSDFTIENDYLTPSLKVKRSEVLRDFASTIDELYTGPKQSE